MLEYLWGSWDHLLCDFESPAKHLTQERLQYFARKVHEKGAPLKTCWGFIDYTIRPICRPVKWQKRVYNGHKKMHSLKYSVVKSPDGLIYHCYGPYEGRRNDNHLLDSSNLLVRCQEYARGYHLYGDPAYGISSALISPYEKYKITPDRMLFNTKMSKYRECVEWGFADITRLWGSLDYSPSQRLWQSSLGKQYRVCVLLTNIYICLYGSETSLYFNCAPPRLSEYLISYRRD